MYVAFTDKAREVLQLANSEARRCGREYIDTEHILLALISVEPTVASEVLRSLGIDIDGLRSDVESLVSPTSRSNRLPLESRAKTVIEYAIEEVRVLSHERLGTAHLLIGSLRVQEEISGQILTNGPLTVEKVRARALEILAGGQIES